MTRPNFDLPVEGKIEKKKKGKKKTQNKQNKNKTILNISSENFFILSLHYIQGYLEPMEKILGSTDASEDLACLFGNIREIFKFGW